MIVFVSVASGAELLTVTVLTSVPLGASISACVTVWLPVHVIEMPGASDVASQVIVGTFGSVTAMPVTVTLPVFVTRNVYGTT